MREEKLNFGIIVRVFVSLVPILFGMPTLATIFCAYNIAMSFIVFGPLTAFVSSLCAICISMFLAASYGPAAELSGLVWGIQAILAAAGCAYGVFNKKRFYHGLYIASAGILLPQIMYTQYLAHGEGMSIAQMLVPAAEDIKLLVNETFGYLQPQNQESIQISYEIIEKVADWVHEITTLIIPSTLIIAAIVTAYIVLWAVSAQLRRLPFGMLHSFSHIKLPRMCVAVIMILVVLAAAGFKYSDKLISMVAVNMLIVLLSLCYFGGISLADFYIRKFIPFKFLRLVLYVIVSLNAFPIFIIAAFIDSFANFRKLPIILDKKGGEAHETEERNA